MLTVSVFEPLLLRNDVSPANEAATPEFVPAGYVPALMPERLTLLSVATPAASVFAEPLDTPLRLKATLLPETPVESDVRFRVAVKVTVPPNVPVAVLTVRDVATAV